MQHDLRFIHPEPVDRRWPTAMVRILGGILYVVGALVVMQVVFFLWANTWI
jgi:hypothetical protein